MSSSRLHRLAAFSLTPAGGNPAGVWVGDELPDPPLMQAIAADVGYSETAFVAPRSGVTRRVRYYSPLAEVAFCGHATVAAGVLLGETDGPDNYRFDTAVGPVAVAVRRRDAGFEASLTSVEPRHVTEPAELDDILGIIGWTRADLDPAIPPARAFAGAWHLVLAARGAARLARLEYDFDVLRTAMETAGLTTLQLVFREAPDVFIARNPFPVGGVVEDPATGAAAAALGGYLRDAGLVEPPYRFLIRQGDAIGRPSRITVDIPERGGIVVSGTAVTLDDPT